MSNLRKFLPKSDWDILRKHSYAEANHKCLICGDTGLRQGYNHALECHEEWEYIFKKDIHKFETPIQKLDSLTALCPRCHEVKHFGLASIKGRKNEALDHLMLVNNIGLKEANAHVDKAFKLWNKLSRYEWRIDCSLIKEKFGIEVITNGNKYI